MAKIKGWNRSEKDNNIIYESDAMVLYGRGAKLSKLKGDRTRITISKFYPDMRFFPRHNDGWQLFIINYDSSMKIIRHDIAIPKKKATEVAKRYMRSHPNG